MPQMRAADRVAQLTGSLHSAGDGPLGAAPAEHQQLAFTSLFGTPGGVRRPAPLFGQHTRAVLLEAGFSDDEVTAMAADGSAICGDEG